jgi:penicillin-binding protein 2
MQPTVVREVTDGQGKVRSWWYEPEEAVASSAPVEGAHQISPFVGNLKWDITQSELIQGYSCDLGYCTETQEFKAVSTSTVDAIRTGTRMAVTEARGTLNEIFEGFPIAVAGKTGTAEYCDDVARAANRCQFGSWPTHSWTLAYAPYENPEIIVLAFAYNGGEGASVAGPIVARVIEAYFELKSIDLALQNPAG